MCVSLTTLEAALIYSAKNEHQLTANGILFIFKKLKSCKLAPSMDLMQNYFKIINFKGAGGPMFKTCQCAPYIAVMTISEFEPHSRVKHAQRLTFPINFVLQITHACITIEM